jgi:large subunit ribosomal protein L20
LKKREYRSLWIIRLSAACLVQDISYSRLINGLKQANILLNRKMLSELAISDPAAFSEVAQCAKSALARA